MARTKIHLGVAAFVASLLGPLDGTAATDEVFARARRQMVDEIAAMARSTRQETGRERFAERVMDAMGKVPRHRFVPDRVARDAYRNHPLPIGGGQTISQPYIVALSTELINPQPEHVVLEIGTGSGYQGWPEHALFDGIVVTAAAPFIPEPLVAQLKPAGRMVIPIESPRGGQDLMLVEKNADGTISKRVVLQVRFVPMTGRGVEGRRR